MRFGSFFVFLLLTSPLIGEEVPATNATRTVSGLGNVVVKQPPTIMRMSIQYRETGKDIATALKSLKDRRDAAKAQLLKFGASENSFRDREPKLVEDDPRMAMMMPGRQGNKKKKKAGASKVTIAATTSCEWALPQGSPEDLLLFVQTAKDKVQATDLAGQKEQKKLSAEEQEEVEEMAMLQQQYGNVSESKPGEPRFTYLAKISAEEQQKARASAYKKAQHQAERLATAAGKKLGKLQTLSESNDQASTVSMMAYQRYQMGDTDDSEEQDTDGEEEGTGASPSFTNVKFSFMVHASFELND